MTTNGQLTLHEADQVPVVASDAASVMAVIARAASDPNTDPDKLERLLSLYERISARQAKAAYTAALAAVQQEIPPIPERGSIKNNSGGVQSKYALWEDINDIIKPILARHGFALSFRTGTQDQKIVVTGILSHKEGHSEETSIYLPADTSGSKNAVQAVGSSTSYGKRYTAQALLNMTSRGEDDDGVTANVGSRITEAQAIELRNLCQSTDTPIPKFCAFMKVTAIPDIAAKDYDRAVKAIKSYGRKP